MSDDASTTEPTNPPDICVLHDGSGDLEVFDYLGEGPADGTTVKFLDQCWIPVEEEPAPTQPIAVQSLPATGGAETVMVTLACCLVAAGASLRRIVRT